MKRFFTIPVSRRGVVACCRNQCNNFTIRRCVLAKIPISVCFANFKILSIQKFFSSFAPITGFPKIAVRGPARPGHVVIT